MKRHFLTVLSLIVISFAIISNTSYGYFDNDTPLPYQEVEVDSGSMSLQYIDGALTADTNLVPGGSVVKRFSILNTGDLTAYYGIGVTNVSNTFTRKNDITYTISNTNVTNQVFPSSRTTVASGLTLEPGEQINYVFTVTYNNSLENQAVDINKEVRFKVEILPE